MVSWNWPPDFPEDCPPEDAVPADGVYYRIVNNDPPQSSDFVSVYHLRRERAMREVRRMSRTLCDTMGLSVYEDRDEAIKCALKYDNLGTHIAAVELTPDSGKILRTRGLFPSHHTWWISDDFDATGLSASVESR